MAHGLFDQEPSSALTAGASQGGWFFDNQTGLLMWKDAAGLVYGRSMASSTASQGPGFATDTYVTGSSVKIPSSGFKPGTKVRWLVDASKTGAGVVGPIWSIRIGVNQTTADTAVGTITNFAQTAVADDGIFTIHALVRSVGAAGVLQYESNLSHNLAATGLAVNASDASRNTGTGFDNSASAVSGKFIGLSLNAGASAAWTVFLVTAEIDW